MSKKIDRDRNRFKEIAHGKIRENLRKYVSHGEMIGRKGRNLVSIPLPHLDLPHFRYGTKSSGGVGQGDGEVVSRSAVAVPRATLVRPVANQVLDICWKWKSLSRN